MASNALECDVCCNVFSEYNCPRNLPCSHTFCGPCIDGIIASQKKNCPICRKRFTATSAEDLMINRIALDVVEQLSKELKSKELKKKLIKESFEEKKTRVLRELKILDEMKEVFKASETLSEMKEGLLETKKEIGRFKEMLRDVELSIEEILGHIKKSGDQLEAATDLTSTDPFQDAQQKVKEIKDLLQKNQREREDIAKEILQMKRRLKTVAEDVEKTFGRDPAVEEPRCAAKVIGGKKKMVVAEEVEKAFGMDPAVEEEPRCAVKVIGGKRMVAPVRVKLSRQVRLSHFAEGDVTPKSLIIEHEALMKTSSRRAFLDLALGEIPLGRVVIKVMDEGNLALNFLHVCAGDLGPSYANSQLSGVFIKGQAGECIYVGTYCKSVIEVDWEKEGQREIYKRTPVKTGEVRGDLSDDSASSFSIITRDGPRFIGNNCLGIVEEGMDVLRDAISQYRDISAVRIVDCGLMFPL